MPRITVSSVRDASVCDDCGRVVPVVKVSDGGFVLLYICQNCWSELSDGVAAAFRGAQHASVEVREPHAAGASDDPPQAQSA